MAHFIHDDVVGGGGKVIRQFLQGLPAEKFEQFLVHGGHGDLAKWCDVNGIQHQQVSVEHLLTAWLQIPRLVWVFRKLHPDIVILHGQWAGPLGAIAARIAGIPHLVYIAHHPSFYHNVTLWRAVRNYIAEKIPCFQSDIVVTLSDRNRYNYLFRAWASEEKLRLIYNGMDPSDLPSPKELQALREREGIHSESRHAVFVGRLDDQKRVDWLLEAWDIASLERRQDSPEWHLWIIGDGRESDLIKYLAEKSPNAPSIHLLGNRSDAQHWLSVSDIAVMSSLYEGHALVPLEAMACSKPVVAFDTDGVGESILHGTTGLLSPLGDVTTLGHDIALLLSDSERASRMGEAARDHLLANFKVSTTMNNYSTMLQALAGSSRGSS